VAHVYGIFRARLFDDDVIEVDRLSEGGVPVSLWRFRQVREEPTCTGQMLGWVNFPLESRCGNPDCICPDCLRTQRYIVWLGDDGELRKTKIASREEAGCLPQIFLT
jgi:hypothetical protein